jgi:hypothetical protein
MLDDNSFLNHLSNISVVASFFPLVVGLFCFKSIWKDLVYVFIYIVISVLVEIVTTIYVELNQNNFFIFHFFTVVEYTLLSLFYINFFKGYFKPFTFYVCMPLFYIVAFFDYMINGIATIDDFSISVESMIFIGYSLFWFYFVLKNLLFENLLSSPAFWINTAILVYFAGNLLLFTFSEYLLSNYPGRSTSIWTIIHSFINILFNILLATGVWKTRIR